MSVRAVPDLENDTQPLSKDEYIALKKTHSFIDWHTLNCELVTPMYGGGVESTQVDKAMPIRASAIRGQLRFWWRLLAKYKWKLGGKPDGEPKEQLGDDKTIRTAEFELWGGMNDGNDDGKAGKVLLRVKNFQNLKVEPWATYEKRPKEPTKYKSLPTPTDWADVSYALFPAKGKLKNSSQEIDEYPHELAKSGLSWQLEIAFSSNLSDDDIRQVWETVRWWANFGGIGARTRRGLGAIQIEKNDFFQSVVTFDEIQSLGFDVKTFSANSAYSAWKKAIEKLQSFRQVSVGRKTNSNRSLWPEPDAIRKITKQASNKHKEPTIKCDYFPRAAFGLPIIFKFKDDGNGVNDEPAQTSLQPKYQDNIMERMSSPLILRPYFDGKSWLSMALLLPSDYLDKLELSLKQPSRSQNYDVNFWNKKEADKVKPISNYGADNPLQAFLAYFAK